MNLSDAQSFVIPRGAHSGRTLQAVGAGHLDDVRELLDGEESDTPFCAALQTFIAWADGQASDDADVPPDGDLFNDPDSAASIAAAGERAAEREADDEDEDPYEGPLGE